MNNESFMIEAIAKAKEGVMGGQTPFGACLVVNGEIFASAHNNVWNTLDITAHAEIQAIRQACKMRKTIDLSDSVLYSTCEPCPMCFSACHWARIPKIVYGARIDDARQSGFNELNVTNEQLKRSGGLDIEIVADFLRDECLEVFTLWQQQKGKAY